MQTRSCRLNLKSAMVTFALVACAVGAYGSDTFAPEKTDPAAAGMSTALLARIPAKMQTYVDSGRAAGFVTIVVRHGHVASLEAVGYQDVEAKTPMRTDAIFRIASMTKSLTAAGVMILVDEGKIGLLDPVEQYIPAYRGIKVNPCGESQASQGCDPVNAARPITVLDLLTHTSGLPGQGPSGTEPLKSLKQRVDLGAGSVLQAQPGTKWIYSQIGYGILGRLIEICSGKSYTEFLTERIFQPLGMTDTTFSLPAEKQNRLAVLYTLDATGKLVRAAKSPDLNPVVPTPEGGAMTTASDMARFYQMLMNKGTLNGKRILSVAAVEEMTTNQTGDLKNVEFSPGLGMGLSFGVIKDEAGTFRYQSMGAFSKGGAFRTYGWGDPTRDMFGIVMYQRTNGGGDTAPETNAFTVLANAAIEH
jgi:CubicO group peptidase (beta-lactamase class C family)